MKTVVSALAVAFIATVGAGSVAQAAVHKIDFSAINLCPTTCTGISYTGPSLEASMSFNLDGTTWLVDQASTGGDQSGLASGGTFALSPVPVIVTYGTGDGPITGLDIVKTWTATTDVNGTPVGDVFTETLDTLASVTRGKAGSNLIGFDFTGTVSDTAGIFKMAPADMVLTLNQAGGSGNFVSASLTNSAMQAIPEPATWVMLALGFVGLGYAAVRRSAKDRSALAI